MSERPLTLRCSYCDGGSMWYTERDQHEYCPAHLFIAQLKQVFWAEEPPHADADR